MDVPQLETLAEAMKRLGLVRLRWREGDQELELEREWGAARAPSQIEQAIQAILPEPSLLQVPEVVVPAVRSPLVGTFYSRPSPQRPPFIEKGQRITPDTVVAIIEAMKVMNEIKAGVHGIALDFELKDGDPVEYGTRLIAYRLEEPCTKS